MTSCKIYKYHSHTSFEKNQSIIQIILIYCLTSGTSLFIDENLIQYFLAYSNKYGFSEAPLEEQCQ